jgi:DUF4097 and DUF4098 domain-containing protein YvlB
MRRAIVGLVVLGSVAARFAYAEPPFRKTVVTDPHGVVEISNFSGRTEVSGWDKLEVEVQADAEVSPDHPITVEGDHGHVVVKLEGTRHASPTVLRIRVPRDSELDISGVSADIVTTDVEGELMLKTISGRIKADVFQKDVEVKTVSGEVVLRGRGKDSGASGIHVSSISGSIRVDRAGGDLEAINVSGDMTLRLDHPAHDVRIRSTSGDVSFEGNLTKGGYLEAQTVSGDLWVHSGPEGPLDYEVNTFSGDIRNCMGLQAERVSKYGPGKRLNGTRGPSGTDEARVRLKTMSGDVDFCDKS